MRTKFVSLVMCLSLALLFALGGCGGGGSESSNVEPALTPPSTPPFTPVAKFTTSELTAHTIYAAASNSSGVITAYKFYPDGTVRVAVNMSTTSTGSASENLLGTYYIDNSGILVINTPFRSTEKLWKTVATVDEFASLTVESSNSSVNSRWFFYEPLNAPKALAFAQGSTQTVTAPVITNANSTVFTVGSAANFALTAIGTPTATFSINGALPPGISFNSKTGILSGTPTTPGTYTLTATASNGVLPNATQTFFLPVNRPTTPVPVPKTWTLKHAPVAQNLRGVVWSEYFKFVAVGDHGTILTSVDGSNWEPRVSGSAESLWSIAWSGTKYVVVGDMNGNILSSVDGITWKKTSTGIYKLLRKVIWTNDQFVAVGWGTILTSPDGTTWTQRTVDTDKELSNIVWTGTKYVAIGGAYESVCFTSTDGIIWEPQSGLPSVYGGLLYGLAWDGSKMITSGWVGTIATSTDGNTWVKTVLGINNLYALTWTGTWTTNQFITVGNNGTIFTSLDGNTWRAEASPTTNTLQDVTCSSDACVAVGGATNVSTILLYH